MTAHASVRRCEGHAGASRQKQAIYARRAVLRLSLGDGRGRQPRVVRAPRGRARTHTMAPSGQAVRWRCILSLLVVCATVSCDEARRGTVRMRPGRGRSR